MAVDAQMGIDFKSFPLQPIKQLRMVVKHWHETFQLQPTKGNDGHGPASGTYLGKELMGIVLDTQAQATAY